MEKDVATQILRDHQAELKASGVTHLRVFGSVARDESSTHSDVDLLVEFDQTKIQTLVSLGRLQERLSELLGSDVDLSSLEWMKEPVRSKAAREALLAF